ncbi:MAG TPA: MFS transporter [Thermoleophilaceae bacterium]|nr:MFS transporter [Thermoleophilaceae bacterium]
MGLGAGGTAGALLGVELAGTDAAAGLPLGLLVLGSAASALLISGRSNRVGRARSLALGYALGSAGAALSVFAAAAGSLAALLAGSLLLGSANASVFLARYAAAEAAGEASTGRALGVVLFSTSVGAIASPLLLDPSGDLVHAAGLPRLSGIYLIAAVAFLAAGATLGLGGVGLVHRPEETFTPTRRQLLDGAFAVPARYGVALLASANFVMVGVMAVAPVYLMAHGEDLEMVGTAISLHVAGMFAPSPLSGWLVDRVGPRAVVGAGCVFMLVAGLGGALADPQGVWWTPLVLVTLGIGWNFGVVGGSAFIAGSMDASLQTYVEGIGEAAMGAAAAVAAPMAGLVVALGGFAALSFAMAVVVMLAAACLTAPLRS